MHGQVEHFFSCPRCGEQISFLLEPHDDEQFYVEDCEVCCNPIEVTYRFRGEELASFEVTLAT